jgi:aminoglycoside phosphotransferase (APT) family kinase protein
MNDIPGIDREKVSRFFRDRVPGGDCALGFELVGGGRSNLTYRVFGSGGQWALRRPPLGHVLPTAHDMKREYRVLSSLVGTGVPAPRPLALCEDTAVNGAPFYVMEFCSGVVLENELPAGFAEEEGERRRIGLALVDTLVKLHSLDYRAIGLEGFGRPQGYLERQVRRWSAQWEGNKTAELPEIDELLARLARALPESAGATVVHGDYRLGNMALDPRDPGRVVAVFDWEMATLGAPLADLGYMLIYWIEAGDGPAVLSSHHFPAFTAGPGFPSRAELVEAYARRSGRDVEAIDFYQVLALTKLAVIMEGIFKRFQMGKTLGDTFEGTVRSTPQLATRALEIAEASSDPRLRASGDVP